MEAHGWRKYEEVFHEQIAMNSLTMKVAEGILHDT